MKEEIPVNIRERLQKLLTLSQRGVGGEASAAKAALERLCSRYGVSMKELFDTEKRKEYRFEIGRGKDNMDLFIRCFSQVVHETKGIMYRKPTTSSILIDRLTTAQYIDIYQLFEWHKEHYKREKEDVMRAFRTAYVVKHRLLYDSELNDDDDKPITPETRRKLARANAIMEWMSSATYHKLLK
jgi:hypothetical protein